MLLRNKLLGMRFKALHSVSLISYQLAKLPLLPQRPSSSMTERFAYETQYLYGRKAPVPAACDFVEALLRHELLAHLPEWLSRKTGVLGCTSSPTILFMCWKEIFPHEDATRFDLVDELYAIPAKVPTSMYQFATWSGWLSSREWLIARREPPHPLNHKFPYFSQFFFGLLRFYF